MKLYSALVFAAAGVSVASGEALWNYDDGAAAAPTNTDTASMAIVSEITSSGAKDILIGLSAEIELFTSTTAKGTNKGGKDTSTAEAGITGEVRFIKKDDWEATTAAAVCAETDLGASKADGGTGIWQAHPGPVTFASRKQELSVDVALEIESDLDLCSDCNITGYVEVGLNLTTTAAHHFNFIADLESTGSGSNPWTFVTCWTLDSGVVDDTDDNARAYVMLKKRMMVLQEVLGYKSGGRRGLKSAPGLGYQGSGTKLASGLRVGA